MAWYRALEHMPNPDQPDERPGKYERGQSGSRAEMRRRQTVIAQASQTNREENRDVSSRQQAHGQYELRTKSQALPENNVKRGNDGNETELEPG